MISISNSVILHLERIKKYFKFESNISAYATELMSGKYALSYVKS